MSNKIIILGGEGSGGMKASAIVDMNKKGIHEFEFVGYLNDYLENGTLINGYPVLGNLSQVIEFAEKDFYFVWAIYMIGHGKKRHELFYSLNIPEERLVSIVHPNAFVAYDVVLEPGVFVMPNSYIGSASVIRKCVEVRPNVHIGHNCDIGELCALSGGSNVGSYCKTGYATDIARNSTVLEKRTIGNYSLLGSHSLLTKDMGDSVIWVGSPAKLHTVITDDYLRSDEKNKQTD